MTSYQSTKYDYAKLVGQKFGQLTVLHEAEPGIRYYGRVTCQCDCGNVYTVATAELLRQRSDAARSCGCARKGRVQYTKHGQAGKVRTKTYQIWQAMIRRCCNPNTRDYRRYGARGIQVCDRWRTFENFFDDMGVCPDGLTLDRINTYGNYEPSNCRWATYLQQNNNRRDNRLFTLNGESHSVSEWSIITGLTIPTLVGRLYSGKWDIADALTVPHRGRNPKKHR